MAFIVRPLPEYTIVLSYFPTISFCWKMKREAYLYTVFQKGVYFFKTCFANT